VICQAGSARCKHVALVGSMAILPTMPLSPWACGGREVDWALPLGSNQKGLEMALNNILGLRILDNGRGLKLFATTNRRLQLQNHLLNPKKHELLLCSDVLIFKYPQAPEHEAI